MRNENRRAIKKSCFCLVFFFPLSTFYRFLIHFPPKKVPTMRNCVEPSHWERLRGVLKGTQSTLNRRFLRDPDARPLRTLAAIAFELRAFRRCGTDSVISRWDVLSACLDLLSTSDESVCIKALWPPCGRWGGIGRRVFLIMTFLIWTSLYSRDLLYHVCVCPSVGRDSRVLFFFFFLLWRSVFFPHFTSPAMRGRACKYAPQWQIYRYKQTGVKKFIEAWRWEPAASKFQRHGDRAQSIKRARCAYVCWILTL